MDINDYIYETLFSQKEQHKVFYEMVWENLKENGFVITDEQGCEIDCIFKAVALKNLVGEFIYRLYDEVNDTNLDDVITALATLDIYEDQIAEYCNGNPNIVCADDYEITVKNALDYTTEITADKMLEEFSADDIFDYLFTATYEFEQDFTFDFDDVDEYQAFVDSNTEQLDRYKEEYPSVMSWVESGMIC